MNSKNRSTNSKLYEFIHSKNNDEADEENLQEKEARAKARLRRTALYGGGARIKIPKIKKKPSSANPSPYTIGTRDVRLDSLPEIQNFGHSAPPGAHTDIYRIVTDNTQMAYDDADRIFYNSHTIKEGLQYLPQPPWYYGNQNNIMPPDGHMLMAARRYGNRGAQNIHQYSVVQPYQDPAKTRTKQTPHFLENGDFVNEWVPPIVATVSQTVNGYESPKKWPVNTEFVHGYPHKKLTSSAVYNRETTIDQPNRPIPPDTLSKTMKIAANKDDTLLDLSNRETLRLTNSKPMEHKDTFQQTWNQRVATNATSSLRIAMKTEHVSHEKHTLMDPSDTMKYSGTTAMIVHTQSTDELKFRLRMMRSKNAASTPFHLRWTHINRVFGEIQGRLKRKETMDSAIMNMGRALQEQAIKSGSETSINRVDFISACDKLSHLQDTSTKQLSIIYSVFDPLKKNSLRFVEFVASLKVLDQPEDSVYQKLQLLWHIHHELGLDRNVFDICLDIMCTCCFSTEETSAMELLFKEEFRAACYKLALQSKSEREAHEAKLLADNSFNSSGSMGGPFSVTSGSQNGSVNDNPASPSSSQRSVIPKKALSLVPQYNICEHYLNSDTFIQVLRICPVMTSTFDEFLSQRIIGLLGHDPRIKVEEEESAMVQDFKWIFAKRGKKIQDNNNFKGIATNSQQQATSAPTTHRAQPTNRSSFHDNRSTTPFHEAVNPLKSPPTLSKQTSTMRSPVPLPALPPTPKPKF